MSNKEKKKIGYCQHCGEPMPIEKLTQNGMCRECHEACMFYNNQFNDWVDEFFHGISTVQSVKP